MKYIAIKAKCVEGFEPPTIWVAARLLKPLGYTHKTSWGRSGSNRKVIER